MSNSEMSDCDLDNLFKLIESNKVQSVAEAKQNQNKVPKAPPKPANDIEAAKMDIRAEEQRGRELLAKQESLEKRKAEDAKRREKAKTESEERAREAAMQAAEQERIRQEEKTRQQQEQAEQARRRREAKEVARKELNDERIREYANKIREEQMADGQRREEQDRFKQTEALRKAAEEKAAAEQHAAKAAAEAARLAEENARSTAETAEKTRLGKAERDALHERNSFEKTAATKANEKTSAKDVTDLTDANFKEPDDTSPDDDDLQVLDVVPITGVMSNRYQTVSDRDNKYAPAVQRIKAFDARVYLAYGYDRLAHRGAVAYYIVTKGKAKHLLHAECGFSDDCYEYALLGALLAFKEILDNSIHEVIVIVQNENIRDILAESVVSAGGGWMQTGSDYAKFMRKHGGLDFKGTFAVETPEPHVKHDYMALVAAVVKGMLKG